MGVISIPDADNGYQTYMIGHEDFVDAGMAEALNAGLGCGCRSYGRQVYK